MKNILSEMSLRTLMAMMAGLLVAIALGFAIVDYRDSRAMLQTAERMAERNRLADVSLQALNAFIAERGRSFTILLGGPPIAERHRAYIDANRPVVDERIARALEAIPESGRARAAEVKALWAQVRDMRPALDRALALAQEQREPAIAGAWLGLANALVNSLFGLVHEVTAYPAIEDAGFEHLNHLRASAVLFRTMVGAESSIFGANALSGRALSAQEIGMIGLVRNQSMMVWDGLVPGLLSAGGAEARAALEKTRALLMDELRPRQDEILAAADQGVVLSGDGGAHLAAYVEASMRITGAAGELTASIGRLAETYAQDRVAQARVRARLALAGMAAILLLAASGLIVFVRRIVRPLQAIQQRIDSLIARQAGTAPAAQPVTAGDECTRVHLALRLLDETMEARQRSDTALHEREQVSAAILAVIPQAIIVADSQGIITLFSPGAEAMLGYAAGEMVGKQSVLVCHDPEEVSARAGELTAEFGTAVAPGFQVFITRAKATGKADEREWTYVRKDGSRLKVLLSITVFRDAQGNFYGCGVATDITQRAQEAAEMSYKANYDPLTQLPNRRLFHDRIQVAISQARRENTYLALLMIDLDRFKPVNDCFGHSVGDLLLQAVARRMQKCLRESDTLARVGGDEFVVILPMISDARDATGVAEKIRQALCEPFDLKEEVTVSIDCSIGIAVYPDHGGSEDRLLKNADNAMYVAKALGRGQVHVATSSDECSPVRRLSVEEPPLVNLVWRRSYLCGDASIDREHRDLFNHGNTLIRAVANGRIPLGQLPEMLDELIESVMMHFRNEEFILARYGYGELESHVLKHQKLVERALQLRRMAVDGELSVADVATFVARDIVAEHLLIDDHEYFPLLRKNLKHDPAETE